MLLGLIVMVFQGIMDFGLALPNGYEVVRVSGGTFLITDHTNFVRIDPLIEEYAMRGKWVIGRTSYYERDQGEVEGFFVLDTKTGKLQQGLSNKQFQQALTKNNIRRGSLRKPPRTVANVFLQGQAHRLR